MRRGLASTFVATALGAILLWPIGTTGEPGGPLAGGPGGSARERSGSVTLGPKSVGAAADVPSPLISGNAAVGSRPNVPTGEQPIQAGPAGSVTPASSRPMADPLCSPATRADARLNDVCFVDRDHGWAVGDRGTIWHTDDGGRHWQLQESGVSCPLYSVTFVDPQSGWAAGGFTHPYLHTSTGVLLSTVNGGRQWQVNPRLVLPALRQVRFYGPRHGWCLGCPSAMFPSGVFLTNSGGQGWDPLPGASDRWLAGAMQDPSTGVLAGRMGSFGIIQNNAVEPVATAAFGLRGATCVRLVPPVYGWLAGEGGLIAMTRDQGRTWQPPPGGLPPELMREFDFSALSVRGPKCWVAGSPGTCVFHSPDAGRTWTVQATGQAVPIRAVQMLDDRYGWTVGELGTILATADGGQSWQPQRSGGSRAALLGLFSEPQEIPLELVARLAGNEGYLSVVEILGRRDVELRPRGEPDLPERLQEAWAALGGSASHLAWQFPLRQAGLMSTAEQIVDGWDGANDGRGLERLEAHLVKQIRLWRPEVVVTEEEGIRGDDPLGRLVNRAAREAVRKAADPACLPQQTSQLGLGPWQVKRLFGTLPPDTHGATEVAAAQLATRLGRSLAEAAAAPRSLLEPAFRPAPQLLAFHLLGGPSGAESERADFFSGLPLPPGSQARRALLDPPAESLEPLTTAAQRRRHIQAALHHAQHDSRGGTQLLANTNELLRGLDADGGGWFLFQLAQSYYQGGKWELAAETFQLLTQRYPQHPLSRSAELWLVQYFASGEAAWRAHGQVAGRDSAAQAVALASKIEQTQPMMFAEPALQFPLAAAYRSQGQGRQAARFYQAASRRPGRDAWWACAEGEQALADRKGSGPKPVVHCAAAAAKPHLDGRLDEPMWQQAKPVALVSPYGEDTEWPTEVKLAYDRQFLYLGIVCRQAPERTYPSTAGPRPRDADLSARDRVEIFLDIDRDFVTYYHLAVDHRGWTADACWGDRSWDPTWFVAARSEGAKWTIEAAIPLDQLTGRCPSAGDAWALGLQRIVPGTGFQSWNKPAAVSVIPEGFGYLLFD